MTSKIVGIEGSQHIPKTDSAQPAHHESDTVKSTSHLFQRALERFQKDGLMTEANAKAYRYGRYHATKLTTDGFFETVKQFLLYMGSGAFRIDRGFESAEVLRFYGQCCKIQGWYTVWIQNDKQIGHYLLSRAFEQLHKEFERLCGGDTSGLGAVLNVALGGKDLARELLEHMAEKEIANKGGDYISLVREKVEAGYPIQAVGEVFGPIIAKQIGTIQNVNEYLGGPDRFKLELHTDIAKVNSGLALVLAMGGVDEGLGKFGLTVEKQRKLIQKHQAVEVELRGVIEESRTSMLSRVYTYNEVGNLFEMRNEQIQEFLKQKLGSESRLGIFARTHREYRQAVRELEDLRYARAKQVEQHTANKAIWQDTIGQLSTYVEQLEQTIKIRKNQLKTLQVEHAKLAQRIQIARRAPAALNGWPEVDIEGLQGQMGTKQSVIDGIKAELETLRQEKRQNVPEKLEALKVAIASFEGLQSAQVVEEEAYQKKTSELTHRIVRILQSDVGLTVKDLRDKGLLDEEILEKVQQEEERIDKLYAAVDLQGFTLDYESGTLSYDATDIVRQSVTTRMSNQWEQAAGYLRANMPRDEVQAVSSKGKEPESVSQNWQEIQAVNGRKVQKFTAAAGLPQLLGDEEPVTGGVISFSDSESDTEYFSIDSETESDESGYTIIGDPKI